jgi:glutamate-ammonia-ligase adenylyltransferase
MASCGRELNVSSDTTSSSLTHKDGETDGAKRISNREFFDRLGRRTIAAISHVDAHGYVSASTCGCVRTARADR